MLRVVGSLIAALAWWCSLAGAPASAASKVADSPALSGIYSRSANKTVWMPERGGGRVSSKVVAQAAIAGPVAFRRLTALPTGDPYLAATPDLQLSPTIRSRARQLQYDPLRIYAHVLGTFLFEPYYHGSLKGADETLLERSGNDTDLSSLLIALLRASNIQARYAQGTIVVPIRDAMRWLGVVATTVPADIFASAGYPVTPVVQGGKTVALEVRHTWVEAFVPVNGVRRWVSMNPSLKDQLRTSGINVNAAAGASLESAFDRVLATADIDPSIPAVYSMKAELLDSSLATQEARLARYFAGEGEGLTLADVIGSPRIVLRAPAELAVRRTFEVSGFVRRYAELSSDQRHYVRIREPQTQIDETLAVPEVVNQRLTLSAVPANASDASVFAQKGGLLNATSVTPVYPELRLGGQLLARGRTSGIMAGAGSLTIDLMEGSQVAFSRRPPSYRFGGFYAIVLDPQRPAPTKIARSIARMRAALSAAGDDPMRESVAGEMLNALGLIYFAQLNASTQLIAGSENAIAFHPLAVGVFALPAAQGTTAKPLGVRLRVSIDVNRYDLALFARNGSSAFPADELRLIALYVGSELEAWVIRDNLGMPAHSTTTCLRDSLDAAVPLYAMNSANLARVQPLLDRSITSNLSYVQIAQSIGAGADVILHQKRLKTFESDNACFIVFNRATGEIGYFIQGGTLGGELAKKLNLSDDVADMVEEAIKNSIYFSAGFILGDILDVDKVEYGPAYLAGKFASYRAFFKEASFRDMIAAITKYVRSNGQDPGVLITALLGELPFGTYIRAIPFSKPMKDLMFREVFNGGRISTNELNFFKFLAAGNGAQAFDLMKRQLGIGTSYTPHTIPILGMPTLTMQGKLASETFQGPLIKYSAIPRSAVYDQATARKLSDPQAVTEFRVGSRPDVATAAAAVYLESTFGYRPLTSKVAPSSSGIDLVYEPRRGEFVVGEVFGKSSGASIVAGDLHIEWNSPILSHGWIREDFRPVPSPQPDAIERTLAAGGFGTPSGATAQGRAARLRAAVGVPGKVRKIVVLVRDSLAGTTIDPRILDDPDLACELVAGTPEEDGICEVVVLEFFDPATPQ